MNLKTTTSFDFTNLIFTFKIIYQTMLLRSEWEGGLINQLSELNMAPEVLLNPPLSTGNPNLRFGS